LNTLPCEHLGQERLAPAISHKKHELLKELLLSARPKPADLTEDMERLECTARGKKKLRAKFHGVYESELQAKGDPTFFCLF